MKGQNSSVLPSSTLTGTSKLAVDVIESDTAGRISAGKFSENLESAAEIDPSSPKTEHTNYNRFQKNIMEVSKGYLQHDADERRDSGFHTMTRYSSNTSSGDSDAFVSRSQQSTIKSAEMLPLIEALKPPSPKEVVLPSESARKSSNIVSGSAPVALPRTSQSSSKKTSYMMKNENKMMEIRAMKQAKKLFHAEDHEKNDVVQHISKTDAFGLLVAKKYMEMFNFSHVTLDGSLRLLLKRLALLGETQERERVLYQFSLHYQHCNPNFVNGDIGVLHTLVCATALLNTDLHSHKNGGRRRMTNKQFISNLSGLGPQGKDHDINLLKDIYRSIKKKPLPWCGAGSKSVASVATSQPIKMSSKSYKPDLSKRVGRSQSMNPPTLHKVVPHSMIHEELGSRRMGEGRSSKIKTLPRKQGVLWRKSVLESDGSKTVKRKRRWRLMIVALQGLELHLAKKDSPEANKVPLHHAVAEVEPPNNATKRKNVFRLVLADTSACLYQASSEEEGNFWVEVINRNASLLSASPLSAGIGSQLKFQRPLLPSAASTLPLTQQLQQQRDRLESLNKDKEELKDNQLKSGLSSSEKRYRIDKEAYLASEIHKYDIYVKSLEDLVKSSHQHLRSFHKLEEKEKLTPDTNSLLSTSPSEPGLVSSPLNHSVSSDRSGSFGNLVDTDGTGKSKHPLSIPSPLSPTTSLPNLHPLNICTFPELNNKSVISHPPSSTTSHVTTASNLTQNAILSTSSTLSTSSIPSLSNSNNSNNRRNSDDIIQQRLATSTPSVTYAINKSTTNYGFETSETGHGDTGRESYPDATEPSHLYKEKHCDFSTNGVRSSPIIMTTSYLSNVSSPGSDSDAACGMTQEDPNNKICSPGTLSPPRVRGRKERRGASRYSYLQAVQDTPEY